jgi:plasmid stabilization system protein ParE
LKVRYSRRASRDLVAIHAYIAERNPTAARRVVERIDAMIELLGSSPSMGRPTTERGTRAMSVVDYPYVIFYRVNEKRGEVQVGHIRHTSRRPPNQFSQP